jgi:hypothetical protein
MNSVKKKCTVSKAIVITTIFAPQAHLIKMGEEALRRNIKLIIIGDKKTPKEFHIDGAEYYSLDRQRREFTDFANVLPLNHYSRKNIGYLAAIKNESKVIHETDDDNIPYDNFYDDYPDEIESNVYSSEKWLNVYSLFSKENIWPRGLSLNHIRNNESPKITRNKIISPLIFQGLADKNPDVDAIYRFVGKLPVYFKKNKIIALEKYTWCPFNSQNTAFREKAFPLLYLPSYCSFRMTDIWRSFIAQRCLWELDTNLVFHSPTVYQKRNEHSILKDFGQEIPGYLENEKITDILQTIKFTTKDAKENLLVCYEKLIKKGFFSKEEFKIVKMWVKKINI